MRLISKTSWVTPPPPSHFLPFWQKLIFTLLYGKFEKNLYVGTYWARTSLRRECAWKSNDVGFQSPLFRLFSPGPSERYLRNSPAINHQKIRN